MPSRTPDCRQSHPTPSTPERLILLSGVPGRLRGGPMDVLYPYCAGIDVHKKTISVCVLTPGAQNKPQQQVRECGTTTRELLELADWLLQNQVTRVGMDLRWEAALYDPA